MSFPIAPDAVILDGWKGSLRIVKPLWKEEACTVALRWSRKTYPSRIPRFRLDFILASPHIQIRRFDVPEVRFSDHLPLVCDFEITPATGKGGTS